MKTFKPGKADEPAARRPAVSVSPVSDTRTHQARIRRILATPSVQPKLEVGPPNDEYEREADRVADQVLRMPDSGPGSPTVQQPRLGAGRLQRMCTACLDEDDETLRAKEAPGGTQPVTPDLAARIQALRGGGQPLPPKVRTHFEDRMGYDFGAVRTHTDPNAAQIAAALNAQAFTVGRDVVFGAGRYAPENTQGRYLLAHELIHVVQQGGWASVSQGSIQRQESDAAQATSRDEVRVQAEQFYELAVSSRSVDDFKSAVEVLAKQMWGSYSPNAVVFSLSGVAGYWVGAGAGFEAVYSPRFGWVTYFQVGAGFVSPGAGAVLEVGVIWGLKQPYEYREWFVEGAISGGPGVVGLYPGTVSGSVFVGDGVGGAKVGGGYGTPGVQVSVLFEWYWQLTGPAAVPDVAFNQHYTFYLPGILQLGKNRGFVVQFNPTGNLPGQIQMQVLYQEVGRREQAVFQLDKGEILNPSLVDVSEHRASFDIDGDGQSDLYMWVPTDVLRRDGGLDLVVDFRAQPLIGITDYGRHMGTLPNHKEYFVVPGSGYTPGGPRFVDENHWSVNPARP